MPAPDNPYPTSLCHGLFWGTLFDITANLGLYSVALMADQTSTPEGSSDKARWTPVKFKEATYNGAAVHIRTHFNGVGAVKTGKMVGYKWGTLKAVYNAIESYHSVKLGFHWDNENGAEYCQVLMPADVWDKYVERKVWKCDDETFPETMDGSTTTKSVQSFHLVVQLVVWPFNVANSDVPSIATYNATGKIAPNSTMPLVFESLVRFGLPSYFGRTKPRPVHAHPAFLSRPD
ncbi:hypothetical protein BU15DRAFT_67429 [Melanogaster broomeanus]|nr:hypothetical protein BU15DRAFT_67429 [Melanogaster broomeanus]